MPHTPGPWYRMSAGSETHKAICNSVGPDLWADEHYIGLVNNRDALLISAAPTLPPLVEAARAALFALNLEKTRALAAYEKAYGPLRAALESAILSAEAALKGDA